MIGHVMWDTDFLNEETTYIRHFAILRTHISSILFLLNLGLL